MVTEKPYQIYSWIQCDEPILKKSLHNNNEIAKATVLVPGLFPFKHNHKFKK